ncbi:MULTISPECIES: hypothetical protein [unclassified Streptomyces]|uniref:hypothetical protein n=1 Tax=unclassified Streptomyces TaxID=2593676 RepID=UPI000DABE7CF|nr:MULTISPECIES: hypothetical protein [unclassified Streptomyces]PZT73674.1 hypothetical protein DNK55_15620 [Streptomyces sp. AC1-42T]PZT83333.1 hypothetical protein DNK56_15805 [Streptomyces sp. AC1-42W]
MAVLLHRAADQLQRDVELLSQLRVPMYSSTSSTVPAEDRIGAARTTGLRNLLLRRAAPNTVWLESVEFA